MLTVFGATALDTIRTPDKVLKGVLGGAPTFAGISAEWYSVVKAGTEVLVEVANGHLGELRLC